MKAINQLSKKLAEKEAFWQQHYTLLKSSGLSRIEYCRENNLNYDQFGYRISKWNKAISVDNNQDQLVSVKLKPVPVNQSFNSSLLCTLDLKNGHQLRIHDSAALMIILERFY